jgi:nitronate monooxygenase
MKKDLLHTELCDMLGIKYPIILAGMGFVSGPSLTAAVSNAGGMGCLGVTTYEPKFVRDLIRETRSLTDKPFGVDAACPNPKKVPPTATEESLRKEIPKEAWDFARKFVEDLGIPYVQGHITLNSISVETTRQWGQICLEEHVPLFVSAAGNPGFIVPAAHAQGMKVMGCVGLVKHARHLYDAGVDAIIAQGHEGGGHTGRIGTMAFVPQVIDAVRPIPVVAAGGIADGRGLAAALALGTIGVWVGTAFVAAKEASVEAVRDGHLTDWERELWEQKMIDSNEDGSVVSRAYTGMTLRQLRNKFQEEWEKQGGPLMPIPYQNVVAVDVDASVRAAKLKDYKMLVAGQATGMIKKIRPAEEIINDMVEGAIHNLERVSGGKN